MPAERRTRLLAKLLLEWLNERYGMSFALAPATDATGALVATDGARRAGVYVAPMWEEDAAWEERLSSMEQRLEGISDGAYILWVPPKADIPLDEPGASYFVQRVTTAATALTSGARTEV